MIVGMTQADGVDKTRQHVDLALNTARKLQSSQTGFLHYNYRQVDYPTMDTIPLAENFLFALALLKDRTAEGIAEGKALLDRLLPFQKFDDEVGMGNFPIYLHEYPRCNDRYLGFQLLPVFYWVLKDFSLVLGADLRERFMSSTRALLNYCIETQRDHPAPVHLAIQLAASSKALGNLWDDRALSEMGAQTLEALREKVEGSHFPGRYVPSLLADILLALQMVYDKIDDSPWAFLWNWIMTSWHRPLATYCGPSYKEFYLCENPQPTLYDLQIGYFARRYSYRALSSLPYQLRAVLIQPDKSSWKEPKYPCHIEGLCDGRRWAMRQHERYAMALLERKMREPGIDAGYAPLKFLWGDLNSPHSFICQGGSADVIAYEGVQDGVDLVFTLPQEVPSESKQRNREVLFFVDAHQDLQIQVAESEMATTFQLGQEITLTSGSLKIRLCFFLERGQGQFFGHIAPGNRPSQLSTEGADRFKSFDWQLFLRTIHRDPECHIRARVRWEEVVS